MKNLSGSAPFLRIYVAAIVTVSTLLAPGLLWADGGNGSGGGNSVVCFSDEATASRVRANQSQILGGDLGKITKIEAYDLYLAENSMDLGGHKLSPIPFADALPTREYSEMLARRFDLYLPQVSELIREGLANFPDSQINISPIGLKRIIDENDVSEPNAGNCVVATMAAQFRIGQKIFLNIDERLFYHPLHSALSRGVIIAHEAIYSTVRYPGIRIAQADSRNTRILVKSLIASAPVSVAELSALMVALGFDSKSERLACAKKYAVPANADCRQELVRWAGGQETKLLAAANLELQRRLWDTDPNVAVPDVRKAVQQKVDQDTLAEINKLSQVSPAQKARLLEIFRGYAEELFYGNTYFSPSFMKIASAYDLYGHLSEIQLQAP
jgi:hypothetical protein